jgi:hypothetical protein
MRMQDIGREFAHEFREAHCRGMNFLQVDAARHRRERVPHTGGTVETQSVDFLDQHVTPVVPRRR